MHEAMSIIRLLHGSVPFTVVISSMQVSGRKPAKPSICKEEGEHYLPLDHGKGNISKPSRGEYSALGNSNIR